MHYAQKSCIIPGTVRAEVMSFCKNSISKSMLLEQDQILELYTVFAETHYFDPIPDVAFHRKQLGAIRIGTSFLRKYKESPDY